MAAKWAATLDGKIATANFDSKWITNLKSRKHVHKLRRQFSAVLIGANTVIQDDPLLTVRHVKATKQPLRIVLDRNGKTAVNSQLYQANTLVVTSDRSSPAWREQLIANGVELLIQPANSTIKQLLIRLGQKKISSILIEGGSKVLTSFLKEKVINKFYCYMAPKIIGGSNSLSPFDNLGIERISDSINLEINSVKKFDTDILFTAYPKRRE